MLVGFGYDVHRLTYGRKLVLGGITIPFEKGLDGHSDADVIIHSLIDALLGAMGEGDIGKHFPDNDMKYKDISSIILLEETVKILKRNKMNINNIDFSVVIESPRLSPYIPEMKIVLSKALNTSLDRINIKATTNEKMGFIGRNEGVAAYCILSISSGIKDKIN